MSNSIYRVFTENLGGTNVEEFVGNVGEVFYDPEVGDLRVSDGSTAGGLHLTGGGGAPWVRPADWLEMPTVSETEQKFVGLFAVYDTPENFIAVYFEGDYTVDWGDGVIDNISGGNKVQHSYVWSDISSDTLTSEGYRQVLVTVTPQSGQNLTIMDLTVRHDNVNTSSQSTTPWLDLAVSMPNADTGGSLRFCGYEYGLNGNGYLFDVQRIIIIHAGGMTDFTECFYTFTSLRKVEILKSPSADNFRYLFDYCTALTDVTLSDTASVTDMSNMFSACIALTTVPLFNTASVTNMSSMFANCYALTTVPLFNTASVTDMSNMFSACIALTTVPQFVTSSVTNMSSMFNSCTNLQTGALSGTKVNISYSNCLLGRPAIVDIFNGLATVGFGTMGEGTQTISIAYNYGVSDLISTDYDIATNKGWNVTT